jgi:hypothetical protein
VGFDAPTVCTIRLMVMVNLFNSLDFISVEFEMSVYGIYWKIMLHSVSSCGIETGFILRVGVLNIYLITVLYRTGLEGIL